MNMKIIFYITYLFSIIFTIFGCKNNNDLYDYDIYKELPTKYYWYSNEKITMIPVKSKSFILIDTNLCDKDKLPKAESL